MNDQNRFVDVVVHPVQTTRAVCATLLRWHDWIFEDHDDPRKSKIVVWIFIAFVLATVVIVLRLARLNDQELIRRFG